jgi:hypothetical protein
MLRYMVKKGDGVVFDRHIVQEKDGGLVEGHRFEDECFGCGER